MTTGFVRARGGKSHSWLTPTISRSNPSANKISVADGNSDTIRMRRLYHWNSLEERHRHNNSEASQHRNFHRIRRTTRTGAHRLSHASHPLMHVNNLCKLMLFLPPQPLACRDSFPDSRTIAFLSSDDGTEVKPSPVPR